MIIKQRTKSVQHQVLESLNHRMNLSTSDKNNFQNQAKGFEGEQLFDQLIDHPQQNGLVINDLFLSTNNTNYQIDSLLILNNQINLYEIKNYSGSYNYENGLFYSKTGYSIQNPLNQVERKKSYLHNLLLNMGYKNKITSFVVFVHPIFYIYSLPPTESILFSGQLKDHFKTLPNQIQSSNKQDMKLAKKLVKQHNENYRPDNLPFYDFNQLRKGILCPNCFSFDFTTTRKHRICASCAYQERISEAIHRSTLEFEILFPNLPINLNYIYQWCGSIHSDYRIRQILKTNFHVHQNGPKTFYS